MPGLRRCAVRAAKLADLFDAVWCMSHVPGIPAGLYRAGTEACMPERARETEMLENGL